MPTINTPLTLACAALFVPVASAATYQSFLYFQENLSEPIGVGTMSFDGEARADGIYAATSFQNLAFSFEFSPLLTEFGTIDGNLGTFSQTDLLTDPNSLSVYLIGTTFHFYAPPSGLFGGSAEFGNSEGDYLAFSPSTYFRFEYIVLIDQAPEESPTFEDVDFGGVYGSITAVPEPSSAALLAGLGTLGLVGLRRRRA